MLPKISLSRFSSSNLISPFNVLTNERYDLGILTKSVLVTTKKDFVRIPKSYRSLVSTLNGEIKFEDENLLKEILSNILENKINDLAS